MKDYGGAEAYAPAQIRASIRRHGSSTKFESSAVAMFSDRERFEKFRVEFGERRGYDEIRGEAALSYVGGSSDLNSLNFLSDFGFADGCVSGHETGDLSGHRGH